MEDKYIGKNEEYNFYTSPLSTENASKVGKVIDVHCVIAKKIEDPTNRTFLLVNKNNEPFYESKNLEQIYWRLQAMIKIKD